MKLVYLAGPIGANDDGRMVRIRAAIAAADDLWRAGVYPFIPHLCHWWDAHSHKEYEQWIAYDAAWLVKCDALYRMPGVSPGADREVVLARSLELPVFTDIAALKRWADGVGE